MCVRVCYSYQSETRVGNIVCRLIVRGSTWGESDSVALISTSAKDTFGPLK